jgi:glycosyltransferase involved in cell wall biosynthesis
VTARGTSISLVLDSPSAVSASLTVARFVDLLERGWDAHLLCGGGGAHWGELLELPESILRRRVHPPPIHLRRRLPRRDLVDGLARASLRRPRAVGRYLTEPRRHPDRYLDAVAVALRPRLVHFLSGPTARERIGVKRALGCRAVVTLRSGDLASRPEGAEDYRPVWRLADVLHVPADAVYAQAVLRGCPATVARAVIPQPGGEPEDAVATDLRSSSAAFRILSVDPLSWTAGYEYALQAVRFLIDRGIECEYRIAGGGDGDFANAVSFARYQLGLEPDVHLLGALSSDEVGAQLIWADAFLDAGVADDYSAAIVQAQAAGLPIVATRRRSPPRIPLDDDADVVLVPKRDPKALAEQLAALAAEPIATRREPPAREERPTLEEYLARFDALYRSALLEGPAGRQ